MGNESSVQASPLPPPPTNNNNNNNNNPLDNQAILKSIEQIGESQYSAKIKCVLLGASGVGKTSFKARFLWDEFNSNQDPTMGASRHMTTRSIANISLNIELWDTGNIERYNSFVPIYLEGCACVIIVYDITDQETFYRATVLLKNVKKVVPSDTIIIIVGNKGDLDPKREQSGEEAVDALKGECYFFEMSCKENKNVHHPLYMLAGMIDRMVESLVQKKVPIPKAKPRLADATPSSILSRSHTHSRTSVSRTAVVGGERLGERMERGNSYSGSPGSPIVSYGSSPIGSDYSATNSASSVEAYESGGEDNNSNSNNNSKGGSGKIEILPPNNNNTHDGKPVEGKVAVEVLKTSGNLNVSTSSPKPRLSTVPSGNWWENSNYVKKVNDEYVFSCAERASKTCECVSVELTVTKTSIIIENTPASSSFTIAPVEGLFRFLSRREFNFLAKGCTIKVSEDTHHPQRLEIWIKRKPFGGLLEGAEIYEEESCVLACPLRPYLVKVLKAQLPPSTTFVTNSHSLTRSDFLQVYRDYCKFSRTLPYRPVEDVISPPTSSNSNSNSSGSGSSNSGSSNDDERFLRLDVSRVLRDSKQLLPVLEALRWNASVQHVDFSINSLGLPGLTNICRISHTLSTLTSIDLSDNKLGRESMPYIIGLIGSLPTLKVLLVDGNNLTDVAPIGVNLYTNTSLTTLGLSRNNITSDSILTFARALVINTTLVSLDLSSNLLTEEVSMPLLNALSCNTHLTRLCVLGNPYLNADSVEHLTLPKISASAVQSQVIKEEELENNDTIGNAGTPLVTTPDHSIDEFQPKFKIENTKKQFSTPPTSSASPICTNKKGT